MKTFFLTAVLLASLAPIAHTQQQFRTPVRFVCDCDHDSVSEQFATKMRDLLAASPRYMESADVSTRWELRVVTIAEDDGMSIAISRVLLYQGTLVTQSIQTCGRKVAADCAVTSFASMDNSISNPHATAR